MLEGMSSDAEDGLFSSEEEGSAQCGELHAVLLCAACVQSAPGFLHEEELCKVALTCHFFSDVTFLCQDCALQPESRVELVAEFDGEFF